MDNRPGALWFRENPRLAGCIITAVSWSVAGWAYQQILAQGSAGRERIAIPAGFGILVGFGFLGVITLIGGSKAAIFMQKMGDRPKDHRYYLFLALLFVPVIASFAWIRYQVWLLGYE